MGGPSGGRSLRRQFFQVPQASFLEKSSYVRDALAMPCRSSRAACVPDLAQSEQDRFLREGSEGPPASGWAQRGLGHASCATAVADALSREAHPRRAGGSHPNSARARPVQRPRSAPGAFRSSDRHEPASRRPHCGCVVTAWPTLRQEAEEAVKAPIRCPAEPHLSEAPEELLGVPETLSQGTELFYVDAWDRHSEQWVPPATWVLRTPPKAWGATATSVVPSEEPAAQDVSDDGPASKALQQAAPCPQGYAHSTPVSPATPEAPPCGEGLEPPSFRESGGSHPRKTACVQVLWASEPLHTVGEQRVIPRLMRHRALAGRKIRTGPGPPAGCSHAASTPAADGSDAAVASLLITRRASSAEVWAAGGPPRPKRPASAGCGRRSDRGACHARGR